MEYGEHLVNIHLAKGNYREIAFELPFLFSCTLSAFISSFLNAVFYEHK